MSEKIIGILPSYSDKGQVEDRLREIARRQDAIYYQMLEVVEFFNSIHDEVFDGEGEIIYNVNTDNLISVSYNSSIIAIKYKTINNEEKTIRFKTTIKDTESIETGPIVQVVTKTYSFGDTLTDVEVGDAIYLTDTDKVGIVKLSSNGLTVDDSIISEHIFYLYHGENGDKLIYKDGDGQSIFVGGNNINMDNAFNEVISPTSENAVKAKHLWAAIHGPGGVIDEAKSEILDEIEDTIDTKIDNKIDQAAQNLKSQVIEELGSDITDQINDKVEEATENLKDEIIDDITNDLEPVGPSKAPAKSYVKLNDAEDFFDTIDFRVGNPGIFEIQKDYKDITVDDVRDAYDLKWKFDEKIDYKDVDEVPSGIDYKGLPHLYDDAELCAYTATISGTERHINPIDVTITDTLTTRYASNNVAVLKAFFAEIANGTIRDCLGFKLSNIYSFEFSTYPASRSEYQSNCIGIPIDFILLGKIQKDEDGNEIKRGGFIAKNALFYTEHSLYMKDFLLYKKSTDSQYTIYMWVTDQYDKNANNYEGSGFTPADTTTYPSLGTLYIDQLQVINCIFDSKKDSTIHYHENKYGWYIKIAGHNHPPIKYRDTANNPIAEVEKNNCINHIYIADSVFHGSASINYDNVRVVKSSRIINNLFDEFTSAPLSSATTNKSNDSDYVPYKRTSPVDSGNNTADDLVFPLYNLQLIKWMACPIYIVGNTFKSRHKLNYRPVKASSSRTISGVKAPYIDGYFRTRFRNMSGEFIEEFDSDNNVRYFYEDDTTSRTECIDQSPLYYTAVEAEGGSYYVCHNTIEDIIFAPCCLIDYYDGVGYYVMDAKGYNKQSSSASGFLDTFFSTHDEIYDTYINSTNLVYVNNHVKNLVKLAQGRGNFGIMKSKSNAVGLVCNPGYIKQGEEPNELRLSYLHHANKCWEYNHYELDVNEIIKLYDDYLLMCEYINSVRTNITYYTPSSGYTHVSDVDDFYIGADNKEKVEKGVKIGTLKEAVLAHMRAQPNISEETIDRVNNALDLYANDWYTTYQYKYLKKTYMTYINTTVPSDKNRVLSIKFDQSQSNGSGTFEDDEYRTVGSLKAPSVIENLVFSHNIVDAKTGIIEGHGLPNPWPCNKFKFAYNTLIADNFTGSEYKAAAGENTSVREGIICIAPYKLGRNVSSVILVGNTINVRQLTGPINLLYVQSYIASDTDRPQYTHYYLDEEGVISTETAVNSPRLGGKSYIKYNRVYEIVRDANGEIVNKTYSNKPYIQIGTFNTSTYRYIILSNDFIENITNATINALPNSEVDTFPVD